MVVKGVSLDYSLSLKSLNQDFLKSPEEKLKNASLMDKVKVMMGLKRVEDIVPLQESEESSAFPLPQDASLIERAKVLLGLKRAEDVEREAEEGGLPAEDVGREAGERELGVEGGQEYLHPRVGGEGREEEKEKEIIFYNGERTIQAATPEGSAALVSLHEAHHIPEQRLKAEREGYRITSQYVIYFHKVTESGKVYVSGGRTIARMREERPLLRLPGSEVDCKA